MKKILVIEDETSLAQILQTQLSNAGFKITTIFDGKEASELLKAESFDLILLDLILPNFDGFEILEEMKKTKNKTPVIVLSNLGQKEDFQRAMGLGAINYFIKSDVTVADIISTIKKFFQK